MGPNSAVPPLLQERYRASLPVKHAELSLLWQKLLADPADAVALTALQQALHRLAGSAGAYGYGAIGDLARDADSLITLRHDGLLAAEAEAAFAQRLERPLGQLLAQLVAEF